MTTRCINNDWCERTIPDDCEGEQCAECDTEQRNQAAYYERLYRASKPAYTADEVRDCYSEPCEYAKRTRTLRKVGE